MGESVEQYGDWNDLLVQQGADVMRQQLMAVLQSPDTSAVDVPSEIEAEPTGFMLDSCLKRFVWTTPDGKVYDTHKVALMKPAQLKGWIGKDLFTAWQASDQRRTMEHVHALKLTRAAKQSGGVAEGELGKALKRFVVLYPSQSIWDRERCEMVPLQDVRVLLNKTFNQWAEDPRREVVDYKKVVFDPRQIKRPEDGYINMFRGLPLAPVNAPDKCMAIRRLLDHLVNHEAPVFEWLMCWLAYPLQNVGAKLATTVLMHAEVQGGGKSLFFEDCIKPIYGEYAATLGQHQLESQYTDWRSKMLFGLFEEVLSRTQKYNQQGAIKHMVTGKTQRIEKKFVSGWEEDNHMQLVFLSNEALPLPVEPSDRRILVVRPNDKLPADLREDVLHELRNGGVAAFFGFLLRWPMKWRNADAQTVEFTTHTEPPMTEAKRKIIDFGKNAWEHFLEQWVNDEFEPKFPHETCRAADLYDVYRLWCQRSGERSLSLTKFSTLLSNRVKRRNDVWYCQGVNRRKGAWFWVDEPKENQPQESWLGTRADKWEKVIAQQQI